jgi:hypothetical protein
MSGRGSGGAGDKPDALLLDEMFSPAIAVELTSRGIDCRAVAADVLLRAQSDLEIFDIGLLEGRVIVTNNVPDFESLRRAREAFGGELPGLIYMSDLTFPRTKAYVPGSWRFLRTRPPATRRLLAAASAGCDR